MKQEITAANVDELYKRSMRRGPIAVRVAIVVVLFCFNAHAALAQAPTARQQEILRTAISKDGWLSEPLHREFWSAVPGANKSDPKALEDLASYIDRNLGIALRFQRATWSSIKLSLDAKRIVKTPDYERTKAEMLSESRIPQDRAGAERGARNADALLEAAAAGKSMNGPNGPFYVTEEMVESVLAGLEGSFHRARKLSNPTWSTQVQEYSFPNEHVRILWDGPFTRETETITLEGGKSLQLTLLSFTISEHEHVAVSFMRFQGRWLDPEGAAIRTVASTLKGMGIQDVRPSAASWRGRVAAEANGSALTSSGVMHASARLVEAPEHGGAWQIMAISMVSLADAITLRGTLERASNFTK